MNSTLIKAAINMIGRDKISGMANDFISNMLHEKDKIELKPGEQDVFVMLYKGSNNEAYYALAFVDKEDRIVRYENAIRLKDFINKNIQEI